MKKKSDLKYLKYRYIVMLFLAVAGVAAIFLFFQGKIVGSKVDWLSQHSVFPDYFRKLFYETGELYPDFAMQIGGGQNIFNFAYYGLLNPCILLSYLFPGISMDDWMMGVSLILYGLSGILFYCWVTEKKISYSLGGGVTLLFLTAAPLFYHFCTQVMFVNYMPFLCLGLIGTDWYFCKNRKGLLCVSVVLMILSSFYFSIGGMICLCLYALYGYLEKAEWTNEKLTCRGILREAFRYVAVIFTSILISSFFLVPTAFALLEGRSNGNEKEIFDVIALVWPVGEPSRILHDKYGMGLGCISLVAIILGCFQKKLSEKVLSISLVIVLWAPFIGYALNGFLYNRGKALIPFIPLVCMETGLWISSLKAQTRKEQKKIISVLMLIFMYFVMFKKENVEFAGWITDLFVVAFSVFAYFHWKKDFRVIIVPSLCIAVIAMSVACTDENMGLEAADLDKEKQQEISQLMEDVLEEDTSLYRMEYYGSARENFANINRVFHVKQNITSVYSSTYNSFYSTFRNYIFDLEKPNRNILMEGLNQNVVFRKMMGVKYWISQDMELHEDENAAPIIYGTSRILSTKDYEKLKFPYNQLAFLEYAIVEEEYNTACLESPIEKMGSIHEIDIACKIEGNPQGKIKIAVPVSEQDRILFVRFHVKNKKNQDITIDVEDSRNKLSADSHIYYNENTVFSYAVLLAAGQKQITLNFGEGVYEISEAEAYTVPLKDSDSLYESELLSKDSNLLYGQEAFIADAQDRKDKMASSQRIFKQAQSVVSGYMEMKKDGYLITSIPYDENFIILVDGDEAEIEMVNEGFLGAKLSQGIHEIDVLYQAPGKQLGMWMTFAGILIAVLYLVRRVGRRKKIDYCSCPNRK